MAKRVGNASILGSVPLFEGMSARELSKIRALMKEEWFNSGEVVVSPEGTTGRFYVVTEGTAKVLVKGRAVRTIRPGGFFGEMSIIDNSAAAATVRAETKLKTLTLSRLNFLALLQDNWPTTRKVLATLCARVRDLDKQVG